jgi:hypothetical protein
LNKSRGTVLLAGLTASPISKDSGIEVAREAVVVFVIDEDGIGLEA